MKQFFACNMVRDLSESKAVKEWVQYDINTLIRDEAEMILNYDDSLGDITDDEFDALVDQKAQEIKDELMRNGIYENEHGQPLFLYC